MASGTGAAHQHGRSAAILSGRRPYADSMCGIAGVLRVHAAGSAPPPPEAAIPESWLDILDDSIKHRGPDGHGRFRDRATRADGSIVDVAFVHRRLAIIDPHDGHQPMV